MRTHEVTRGRHYDYLSAALWRRRNNGGNWTLLETPFTSYFLQKFVGKASLAVSTFFWKKLVHSLAEHFQTPVNELNYVDVENSQEALRPAGRTKCPRGPHAAGDPCSKLNNSLYFVERQDLRAGLSPSLYYRIVSTFSNAILS